MDDNNSGESGSHDVHFPLDKSDTDKTYSEYLYTYHAGANVLSPLEERIIQLTTRIVVGIAVVWVGMQELREEMRKYRHARRRW